jgi:UDP-2,3-diacylglucosamine hydrolase
MGYSLFISDLHLCESRPEIIDAFTSFLENTAAQADALYILGDLFEYWAGDDVIESGVHAKSIQALKKLSQQDVSIYLIHGNRDFLLGDAFSQATNIAILQDPSLINLYGNLILLSHGDALCTDDLAYQTFREEVRSDTWKTQFLNQPLTNRIAYIESVRKKSEQEKSIKSMTIMDVNPLAVTQLLKEYNYPPTLIHGHTHRPMKHQLYIDGHRCERWVLGDWYDQGSYLKLDHHGFHVHKL